MAGMAGSVALGVAPDRARALCVLVHGRGQSPEDMQAGILRHLTTPDVAWLLPRAEGASWYAARAIDPLTPGSRAELERSLRDVAAALQGLQAAAPRVPLLLAGFSQGACLALELALSGQVAPAALVSLTGCRVGVAGDDRPAALRPGLPVYLSAGDADPWIPLPAFAETVLALGQARAALRADVFPGRAHGVSATEIALLDGVLADLAAGRSPRMGAAR